MNLREYLSPIDSIIRRDEQIKWFQKIEEKASRGQLLYQSCSADAQERIISEFQNRVRTEEIKAWYSEPEGNSLFQGTSVSSLTIPYSVSEPLKLDSINDLEEKIADAYVELHIKYVDNVRDAIQENIDEWISQGLFYGMVISSKIISQAFDLSISYGDVVFNVNGYNVDPHEITSYPKEVREAYFKLCKNRIECFNGFDLEQSEFESSLVLADISKPKLSYYKNKILLAPIRCNEIAAILSERITKKIAKKTSGKIMPKSLAVIISDTDTPYTYHKIMGYNDRTVLPGLTVLGSSGTIDALRWLYTYRLSLIAQKIQKSSLYSEVKRDFMPFVFFGVLVWRDALILLDLNELSRLRYKGNLSSSIEFAYLAENFYSKQTDIISADFWEKFRKQHYF